MDILDKLFSRELNRRTGARAIKIDADKTRNLKNRLINLGKKALDAIEQPVPSQQIEQPFQSQAPSGTITKKQTERKSSLLRRVDIRFPWLKIVAVCLVGFIAILDLLDLTISKTGDPYDKIKIAPMSKHVRATARDLFGKKLIALTFDDGPSGATTPTLLDILKEKEAPATFFTLGTMARNNPDLMKRAEDEGHEVASHTMYHQNLVRISASAAESDINEAKSVFNDVLGHEPTLIRPPYGNINNTVRDKAGAPLILWSVDSLDWKNKDVELNISTILSQVHDGAIILMHDIYPTSVDSISRLVDILREDNYEFVTVSKLAKMRGVELKNGESYRNFPP